MYNYLIIIAIYYSIVFAVAGKQFEYSDIIHIIILSLISTMISYDIIEIKRKLRKLTNVQGRQRKTKGNKAKCYFVYNTNDVNRRYRKYEIKSGKVYRHDELIKPKDIPDDAKVVKLFKTRSEVKQCCLISISRYDGVVFTTTQTQYVYPNGFIVTITHLLNSTWTVIDVSDYDENTDFQLLQRLGSDETGRFYIQTEDELLFIMKIIYNLKGRYRYEDEYES